MNTISAAPVDINSIISMLLGPIGRAPQSRGASAPSYSSSVQPNDNLVRLIDLQYTGGEMDGSGLLQQLSLKALIGPASAFSDFGSSDGERSGYDAGTYQVQPQPRDLAAGRAVARQAFAASMAVQIGTLISRIG
jgi:hypothetical protein